MSGLTSGRKPDTDAQWARDVEKRLQTLEAGGRAVRIGEWVIADRDGKLVATTADGRRAELTQLEDTVSRLATPAPAQR